MHLVFLNQYYPPDAAPTGVMLQAVAEECARQGHQVTVICAAGGYADGGGVVGSRLSVVSEDGGEEEWSVVGCPLSEMRQPGALARQTTDNRQPTTPSPSSTDRRPPTTDHSSIRIHRLAATRFGRGTFVGKLLDYASYYVGVAWRLGTMDPPPERIVALTTPPYLSVLARAVSKLRGADHAHWVMDLYPDVMVAHGMLAEGGWKHRLLAGLARWGFGGRRCAAVLTLGPDMAERCERVVGGKEELSVVGGPLSEMRKPGAEAQPTTDHRPPTTLSWVPLWGAEGKEEELSVVGGRLSGKILSGAAARPTTDHGPRTTPSQSGGEEELSVVGGRLSEKILPGAQARPTTDNGPRTTPSQSGGEEELSVVGGQLSEKILPGAQARPTTDNGPRTTNLLRVQRGWAEDELVVMYSGNMGLGHRFGEVLEVVRREEEELSVVSDPLSEKILPGAQARPTTDNGQPTTDNRPPTTLQKHRFVFYGGGKRRGEIEAFMAAHPGAPVELHDYAAAEELTAHLMTADVHLVSLEPAWSGTMVPSKLQGIFAVGRPVVFVGSRESSIGRWVEESGGGWVVAAGDVEGLREALEDARDPNVRQARGEAAGRFAKECFDRETNVKRVVEVLAG